MKRAGLAVIFGALALAACSDTTSNPLTQLNLERPVDVSFACYGGLRLTADGTITSTAQPIASCDIRSGLPDGTVKPVPPGQEDMPGSIVPITQWYAFILQSARGTVAIARFDTQPSGSFSTGAVGVQIQDADPLTPGTNGISVGEDPIAIATDVGGCKEVIANAGTCDLSILDINTAIESIYSATDRQPPVTRMDVKNRAGTVIHAKPVAMAFQPPGGTIGDACAPDPQGLAYIAYPNCHIVAGVDVSTGTIVTGVQFDANGVASKLDPNTITCQDECEATMAPSPGVRPVAIDLEKDARTGRALLAIGADNSNVVSVWDLDPLTFYPLSLNPPVPLENTNGRLGVTSLAISPVIGMGGSSHLIDDDAQNSQHQFIYAVANDASVRVIDVEGLPRECDTQVDPRYIHDLRDIDRASCFPNQSFEASPATCTADADCGLNKFCVPDPSSTTGGKRCSQTPPRRAGVKGPGIQLIADAVPTSVDFVRADPLGCDPPPAVCMPSNADTRDPGTPLRMIGYFAVVTSAAGQSYVVNVDNDDYDDFVNPAFTDATVGISPRLGTQIPLVIPHQLRDAVPNRGADAETKVDDVRQFVCNNAGPDPDSNAGISGGPRATATPARTVPPGTLAAEKYGGLPSIHQVLCESPSGNAPVSELSFSAPLAEREAEFPDLHGLRSDETWNLSWEGSLSLDKVDSATDGPAIRFGQLSIDGAGMHMIDQTKPFCDAGVEQYDIVQLRGCDPALGDAGCPLGYTCYVHPQSQVSGLGACMLADEAERLANACREFLVSTRRYTVGRTTSGELKLLPRKHELRTTPLDGCTSDDQCHQLATYALHNVNSANPKDDTTSEDTHHWLCQADTARKPKAGTGKRCLEACNVDTDCATGTVCHPDPDATGFMGYCMEGVIPPQSCVNAPQRYELRAAEAFAVVGTKSGYVHSTIADTNGNCVKDPKANPLMIGRIPLDAPACDPSADPLTGRLPDGSYQPNPCKATVDESEYMLNYVPNTCTLDNPDENLITRQAEAIEFRNRGINLTIVDPTYPGDAQCNGDRGGTLGRVPLVMPGFSMSFRLTGGFVPLALGIQPSYPVKVVRGPQQSIWVIDEGDYLSTSVTTPSTRGKVYRVEANAIGTVNVVQ